MDSPRGRIYLMRGILQSKIAPIDAGAAPPRPVPRLPRLRDRLPLGRANTATSSSARARCCSRSAGGARSRGSARWFGFSLLLPSRAVQRVVFKLLWLLRGARAHPAGRLAGAPAPAARARWRPRPRRRPSVPRRSFREQNRARLPAPTAQALVFPARGERRHRVALLTGCLADQLFADVNDGHGAGADRERLRGRGAGAASAAAAPCTSTTAPASRPRRWPRDNVRAFADRGYDAIVSNAAGCSAELRHYGELLDGDPAAAALRAPRCGTSSEFLCEIGWKAPTGAGRRTGRGGLRRALPPAARAEDQRAAQAAPAQHPRPRAGAARGGRRLLRQRGGLLAAAAGAGRRRSAIARSPPSGAAAPTSWPPATRAACCRSAAGAARGRAGDRVVHPIELLADAYRASGRTGQASDGDAPVTG